MDNQQEVKDKLYQWDFSGSCAPGNALGWYNHSFSVGIFQWIPKSSGEGLKKSAVIKRVKGLTSDPESVYAQARAICAEKNKKRERYSAT